MILTVLAPSPSPDALPSKRRRRSAGQTRAPPLRRPRMSAAAPGAGSHAANANTTSAANTGAESRLPTHIAPFQHAQDCPHMDIDCASRRARSLRLSSAAMRVHLAPSVNPTALQPHTPSHRPPRPIPGARFRARAFSISDARHIRPAPPQNLAHCPGHPSPADGDLGHALTVRVDGGRKGGRGRQRASKIVIRSRLPGPDGDAESRAPLAVSPEPAPRVRGSNNDISSSCAWFDSPSKNLGLGSFWRRGPLGPRARCHIAFNFSLADF
ncbi:hypothetical protein MSAN_01139300 [Mycena sanguinolenta]|uniref:Uncharacterized protein n=1 Tax=Mycena sanguinolenta TaxID=230812 RepID=A0A8H6YL61_9AGAR|nr:hypothetical protein MSAN_01139300 [Mycena sanguinolenta]